MANYKVISDTLSGMFKGKDYKKNEVISEAVYGFTLSQSLIKRGFLEKVEDAPKEDFSKLTVAELKEKIVELGADPVEGKKSALIKQLEDLV
tara:strand:- start:6619 stop:6894 length:276 start_codon:yes stop_codon:yes gene_type:complete